MKRNTIDTSREARLWIGQVFIPAITCAAIALSNDKVRAKASDIKNKVISKFKKK